MRVHALRITAFGPFAGSVDIDMAALSEPGLFLLTGPTGAGKTSVLDAICFGLYGQVPGARQQAARLRSDHAEPGVAPGVILDVTLSDRRLRITRSPRWHRPSSRARSGSVHEQARVLLQERADDGWRALTTRIDEAQLLLDGLLGMTLGQFTQVTMLPQGRFQEFLRTGAEERSKVLERLFGTQRFRDVERWLVDHRARSRAAAETAERAARSAADRLHGAAHQDTAVPDDPEERELWGERVVVAAQQRRDDLHVLVGQLRDVREVARQRHRAGIDVATLRRRGEQARQRLAEVESTQADADDLAATLQAAERAREVTALLEPLVEAASTVDVARQDAAEALAQLHELMPDVLGEPPRLDEPLPGKGGTSTGEPLPDRLRRWGAALETERTRLERAGERELHLVAEVDRLARLDEEVAAAESAAAVAAATLDGLRTAVTGAPEVIATLRAAITTDERLDATHDHLCSALAAAREQAAQVEQLSAAQGRLRAAEASARAAFAAYRAAADDRLDIARRRLAGAAAELAHQLVDGAPCAVCGSPTHPRPAPPIPEHPDEAAEVAAQRLEDRAEVRRRHADAEVVARGAEVTRIDAASGGRSHEEIRADVATLERQHAAAEAARARLPAARSRLAEAETAAEVATGQVNAAAQHARDRTATTGARRAAATALRDELVAALGSDLDIVAVQDQTSHRRHVVGVAVPAVSELHAAASTQAAARASADRAARRHGFPDAAAARADALDQDTRDELRAGLERRRRQLADDRDTLADPEVAAALTAPAPDLTALAAAERTAEQRYESQCADLGTAQRSADRLGTLLTALRERLAEWQPLRQRLEVASGLAALAEGKSADNQQRMSLSSYVLAARLEQVVAAANERLVPMTSGRYALEHTVDKSAGDRRAATGGLGLRVRDEWTGELRDPSTLSGGETFQASLALALGLSDVVGQESGGTQLQTIFVDEGFGSLDADSLDDVMDELDRLREGGRVVGVVSHVDTMRERIPTQLRLDKARTGSTVARAS